MAASDLKLGQFFAQGRLHFCGDGLKFQSIMELAQSWNVPPQGLVDIARNGNVAVWFAPKSVPEWSAAFDTALAVPLVPSTLSQFKPPLPESPRVVIGWIQDLCLLERDGSFVVKDVFSGPVPRYWAGTLTESQSVTLNDLLLDENGARSIGPAALELSKLVAGSVAVPPPATARDKSGIAERQMQVHKLIIGALTVVLAGIEPAKYRKPKGINVSAVATAVTSAIPDNLRTSRGLASTSLKSLIKAAVAEVGQTVEDDGAAQDLGMKDGGTAST